MVRKNVNATLVLRFQKNHVPACTRTILWIVMSILNCYKVGDVFYFTIIMIKFKTSDTVSFIHFHVIAEGH